MNKHMFIGNITADAEVKVFEGGGTIISFSVAINKKYTDKEGVKKEVVTFVNCNLPVPPGGSTTRAKYLLRGTKVFVIGEPKARAYTSGVENKAVLDCRVSELELLGGPNKPNEQASETNHPPIQQEQQHHPDSPSGEIVDDLPF